MTITFPNTDPIYTKEPNIYWSGVITAAANDYTGQSALNQEVFDAHENGGFLQKLRFKALGTNVATVARIFLNNGHSNQTVITAAGTPTGVASTGVGTMGTVTVYAKILPIGEGGDVGTISAESTGVAVTGPTGSVMWTVATPPTTFTVVNYRIYVGRATGAQAEYFNSPKSTVTAQMSGTTTMTVTAIVTAPDIHVCAALGVGSVFASGPTAGDFIVAQLTSSEADGALGRTGTYQMSTARTFGPGAAVTDPLKYNQLSPAHSMIASFDGQPTETNNCFIGEVSLPATTAIATAATVDIDYPLNIALPPGYEIYVGLGTAVASGWQVSGYGGHY